MHHENIHSAKATPRPEVRQPQGVMLKEASSAFSQSNDVSCPDSEMHGSLAAERAGKSVMTSLSPV